MPEMASSQSLLKKSDKLNSFVESGLMKPMLREMNCKNLQDIALHSSLCKGSPGFE